jgi:stage V sporulation protein G
MEITGVKIIPVEDDEKLKAFVTVEFDGALVIRDLKVIKGETSYFVAMPSKKLRDGSFKDIVYAIDGLVRKSIEERVIAKYEEVIKKLHPEVA